MPYNYYDFEYYLAKAPFMSLMKSGVATLFIEREIHNVRSYSKFISLFPSTKCEPLEFLYQCHESLCALDELLFEDFLNFGWQGVVWASWLGAITPFPEPYMERRLNLVLKDVPHNRWIVELALASLSNESKANHLLLESIYQFREYLGQFSYVKLPLRKWPSREHFDRTTQVSEIVLSIYKKYGVDAALNAVRDIEKTEYDLPYKEWYFSQTPA